MNISLLVGHPQKWSEVRHYPIEPTVHVVGVCTERCQSLLICCTCIFFFMNFSMLIQIRPSCALFLHSAPHFLHFQMLLFLPDCVNSCRHFTLRSVFLFKAFIIANLKTSFFVIMSTENYLALYRACRKTAIENFQFFQLIDSSEKIIG